MKNDTNKPGQMSRSEASNRMKNLMGLNEEAQTKSTHGFELVKKAPDGNAYAIVRENHEYFLKRAKIKENLTYNDFNYIGGLPNKRKFVFESFSKATQSLNLRLLDLNENFGVGFAEDENNFFKSDLDVAEESMVTLGGDMEFMPEEDIFADEMSEEDIAIDNMINQTLPTDDEVSVNHFAKSCVMDTNPMDSNAIESMTDRVMENYKNLDSILTFDQLKKKA
jgi:hypothetical protein